MDAFLLDRVFQPLVDRLPSGASPWQLGMNCQLGALVFQAFAIGLPILFFHMSPLAQGENVLAWGGGLVLFLGFMRMKPNLSASGFNPLRATLASLRIMAALFLLYDLYLILRPAEPGMIFDKLACIGDIAFVIGLYFMSCRRPPPKRTRRDFAHPRAAWGTAE